MKKEGNILSLSQERDTRCFICKHDIDEHEYEHRPYGQSGKRCYHGNCKCNYYESMYEADGSKRRSIFD